MKNTILIYGLLCLDIAKRKAYAKGRRLVLRNKEFNLLQYFMNNIGRVLTRSDILEFVWDRNLCCKTNTVDVHVCSLRNKLKFYLKADCIRTIHCVGYIFDP